MRQQDLPSGKVFYGRKLLTRHFSHQAIIFSLLTPQTHTLGLNVYILFSVNTHAAAAVFLL